MRAHIIGPAVLLLAAASCGGENGPSGDFTLTVTPAAAELFTVAPGNTAALSVVAKDESGQVMAGGTPTFATGNAAIATVDAAGTVTGTGAGSTQITTSLTLDGTTETAATTVTVEAAPATATVLAPAFLFTPTAVDVQAGGSVTWSIGDVHHTVAFTSPGAPADIPELQNSSDSRAFPSNGTYDYHCTIHPSMTGKVRVH